MLQAVCATAASLLLLTSCGVAKVSSQAVGAELRGSYRLVCNSLQGPLDALSRLRKDCSSNADMAGIRVSKGDTGHWIVTNFADQPLAVSVEWKQTVVEGHPCLGAPFVSLCKVPRGISVFGAVGGDTPISSATGYVFLSQGLIADLIKVETNE
ncbi:hypothetical protein [Acidovorax sp. Root275]|uniref:hypothetical protein n=1 Tax=Acidovorax sp. Root275 TaxID=1736508 RepID=UPI001124CE09|nr:hypothetical protein [Acidovorax sp. Root275]